MKSCGSRAELAARIPPEVARRNKAKINLRECHGRSCTCWFCFIINHINENAQPLITRAVGVDCTTSLPGCFYLDTFGARFNAVVGVHSANDQVGMPIKVAISCERPG